MYITKNEHDLAARRRHLQLAQMALVSARHLRDPAAIRRAEAHVCRMLDFVTAAQEAVARERMRRSNAKARHEAFLALNVPVEFA